jgi:hypothetical protein
MRQKAFLYSVLLLACLLGFVNTSHAQDVIYTKDGPMFKGRILEEFPNVQVILKDTGGEIHLIPWISIERIRRGNWTDRKSATVSWALSFFLFPGLGQIYNGEKLLGSIMMAVASGGGATILASRDKEVRTYAAAACFSTWFFSFIDAPTTSIRMNRERGYSLLFNDKLDGRTFRVPEYISQPHNPTVAIASIRIQF